MEDTRSRVEHRLQLRARIIGITCELLLEQGLKGVSMRTIAERVQFSPAALYLYFRDKDELITAVVAEGFARLGAVVEAEMAAAGHDAPAIVQYRAMGRGYATFALENPAFFRVMFELPGVAKLADAEACPGGDTGPVGAAALVERAVAQAEIREVDPRRVTLVGWGLIHGLVTLYLSGHLHDEVAGPEELMVLVEDAMQQVYEGWRRDVAGGDR